MEEKGKERRKYNRYASNITSLCIKRSENQNNLEMDVIPIKNMGLGGVFLQTDIPYKTGTVIDIQFIVPEYTKPVTIRGKVVWVKVMDKTPGMGIEFISISDKDKDALVQFFNKLKQI